MKTTMTRLSAVLIASALSMAASGALAQTAKPAAKAAKPAAKGKSGDKIQTKEELRACMMLKESNNTRTADLEKRNEDNRKQKAVLMQSPETASAAAKADVEAKLAVVKEADNLVRENGKAISDWNERMNEFDKNSKEMRNADRRRQVLKDERYALKAKDDKLVADRAAKIAVYEAAVAAANEQIAARAKAAEEWNKSNDALADEEDRLAEARDKWIAECAKRRFLDDDEKEIKAEMKAGK